MKKYLPFYLYALLLAMLLQGCLNTSENDFEERVREADEAIQAYLTEHNIEAEKLSSGVYAEPLLENDEGKQVSDDHVAGILYTIKQLGKEQLIESYDDSLRPLKFSHSQDALIPAGLNYGLAQMQEGEKFRFYIPSYLAFGDYSHDNLFSSNANFIMEVQLVDLQTEDEIYEAEIDSIKNYIQRNNIESEEHPNGLHYVEVKEGTGETPDENDLVEFHFTRKYLNETVIETTEGEDPISVYLNDNYLVEGLGNGLKLMKEGGEAILIMPSEIAFGKSLQVIPQKVRGDWENNDDIEPKVRPYMPVIYEIELLEVN